MVVSVTLDFVRDVCYDECRVSMREDDALDINVISRRSSGDIKDVLSCDIKDVLVHM